MPNAIRYSRLSERQKTATLQANHRWRAAHREEERARKRAFYQVHREQVKAKNQAYREAHHDEVKARNKAYERAHPEERKAYQQVYRLSHTSERKASHQAYQQAHPEEVKANGRKYRALKMGVGHRPYNVADIIARDRSICGLCGKRVTKADQSIDHILPLSLGGADALHNVQLAHRRCNLSKKNSARFPANLRLALE